MSVFSVAAIGKPRQALQAATRRDRLTARLPMLRRPHAEGLVGAVWAEVRGRTREGVVEHRVMASTAPQATAAAAVAAAVARGLVTNTGPSDSWALGGWTSHVPDLLRTLPDDVRLWTYDGAHIAQSGPNAPLQAARKWRGTREITRIRPIGANSSGGSGTFA